MSDNLFDNILNLDESVFQSLKPAEKEAVIQILKELESKGESTTYKKLINVDYEEIPVDIDTFIEDDRYIGKTTNNGKNIYPYWRDKLRKMFSPENNYQEFILTGAIGLGKTTIAITGMSYVLYKLLCLRNPQQYYGLQGNSEIVFAFFNVNLDLSFGVAYKKFQSILMESPWFLDHGKIYGRQDKNKYYQPNKKIRFRIGSQEGHGLGQDIFCLTGDTRVNTIVGDIPIKDLEDEFIYVISEDNGKKSMSNLCKVMKTGETSELYEIELEDGSVIKVTGNHMFKLKNGQYKRAMNLTENDELMDMQ